MQMISRHQEKAVKQALADGKIAILYGPRQVGKTTLAKKIASHHPSAKYFSCDEPEVVANLQNKSALELRAYLGTNQLIIIDEAQRVENIGLTLKIIHDTYPEIQLIATGSSSFDLSNKINEPLTGRSREILLYPLSVQEVSKHPSEIGPNARVMMKRGGYPGIWPLDADRAKVDLQAIANNYLFRDAFNSQVIYDPSLIMNLLKLLAYQIGNEVSYGEIASKLEISKETVKRYIFLLEKAYIIFRVNQYRRNQRVEVGRLRKVYFIDLGIRNALVAGGFSSDNDSDNIGALWENFCMIERLKFLQSNNRYVDTYYWRNREQREIDLVEQESDQLRAYEFKYGTKKLLKVPVAFARLYPKYTSYQLINPDNILTRLFL